MTGGEPLSPEQETPELARAIETFLAALNGAMAHIRVAPGCPQPCQIPEHKGKVCVEIRPILRAFAREILSDCLAEHPPEQAYLDWPVEKAKLEERCRSLAEALEKMTRSAEGYMGYHTEKFYGGMAPGPTGLWPAIDDARSVLRAYRSSEAGKEKA